MVAVFACKAVGDNGKPLNALNGNVERIRFAQGDRSALIEELSVAENFILNSVAAQAFFIQSDKTYYLCVIKKTDSYGTGTEHIGWS